MNREAIAERIVRRSLRSEIEDRVSNFDRDDYESERDMVKAALVDFITWFEDEEDNAREDYRTRGDMNGYRRLQVDVRDARKILKRMDSTREAIAERVAKSIVARKRTLDVAKIAKFRKDFLTLMKNVNRVKDYDTAITWSEYVSKWSRDLNDYLYKYLLEDFKDMRHRREVSEGDWAYWEERIRVDTWSFVIGMRVPISREDGYYSKEARFQGYEREMKKWDRGIKTKARVAWKVLGEFVRWYKDNSGHYPSVDVPEDEKIEIEGFSVTFRGHDSTHRFEEKYATLQTALRHYKSRASRVLPALLKHRLPLLVDLKEHGNLAGEYQYKNIAVSLWAFGKPKYLSKVIAHEMAHHLHFIMGAEKRVYWSNMLSGDRGELDLRDVIKKYGDSKWIFDNKTMMRQDPFMYNQLRGLEYTHGPLSKVNTLEELRAYLDEGGKPVISVHSKLVSGYANKNAEEAFCEAIGLLVAYGPRAVHPEVRSWLKTIQPSLRVSKQK